MLPLVINSPEEMLKIRVACPKKADVLATMQRLGIVHVEAAGKPLEMEAIVAQRATIRTAIAELEEILELLPGERVVVVEALPDFSLDEMLKEVETLRSECHDLMDRQSAMKEAADHAAALETYVSALATQVDMPLSDLEYTGPYLFGRLVVVPGESGFLERAGARLLDAVTVECGDELAAFIVGRSADREQIDDLCSELGGFKPAVPAGEQRLSSFLRECAEANREWNSALEKVARELRALVEGSVGRVVRLREGLIAADERLRMREVSSAARYTQVTEGWVPKAKAAEVEKGLTAQSVGPVELEMVEPPPRELPPTKLHNARSVRPFELIVKMFSIPKYGDWDPTPAVAYSFALFYGVMLSDMIYAIGLIIIARFFLQLVVDPESDSFGLFRNVLYVSGAAAMAVGALSGVYLGDFPRRFLGIEAGGLGLVRELFSDPITFIQFALVVGLIHLNLAHGLAFCRGIRERNAGTLIGKMGLFLLELCGIPYLLHALFHVDLFLQGAYAFLPQAVGLGVLLLITGTCLQMGGLGIVFWMFEITGLLGDVMSYSRLAAVGLATYYLAACFNLLVGFFADMTAGLLPGPAGQLAGFVLGLTLFSVLHVFNLLLSSLAAFVHSLRLVFVEFLFKFFDGGGREYDPFRLGNTRHVVVGRGR